MKTISVRELQRNYEKYLGSEVNLAGWVKKIRAQKEFGFIELNDGSFFNGVQVVYSDKLANFDEISRVSISSTIISGDATETN